MKKSLAFVLGLLVLNGLASTVSCSSKVTSKGTTSSENTSSTSTSGATGASVATATGSATTIGSGGSTGAGASSSSGGSGGSLGEAGSGGVGGTGGIPPVAMNCEADDPDCTCDASGCYIVDGAACLQASACKSQNCGVTQDNDSVCCAEACAESDVCAADGSGCGPATACEDADTRCSADGDYQLCEGGQWTTTEPCDARGCNVELGGCLLAIGDPCTESDECGEGTCQVTPDGSTVCCDLSCGDCKTCSADGTSCVYPETVSAGCDCSSDSDCNDDLECTDDVCTDGLCANNVVSGSCVIDDQCYDHNQPELNNPCRYCDADSKNRGWTNSSNSVSCDDGLYCNGNDSCNGVGACQHQFPTNDRCNEDGPCALTECDEDRDSCYEPAGTQCLSRTERQCESGCGGDVQSRTVTANCTGNSPDCTGTPTNPAFVDSTACNGTQACNPSTFTCQTTLECTDKAWCDPNAGGLCWSLEEPALKSHAEAIAYCDGLTLAGANWHLPTIEEWLAVAKGCDGVTQTSEDADFQSTCEWADENFQACSPCELGEGPGSNGCYWPPGMGACRSESPYDYWSSTIITSPGFPAPLYFEPASNYGYFEGTSTSFAVRCATDKP